MPNNSRSTIQHVTLALALSVSVGAVAQDWRGRGSLRGQVTDDAGQPLADIEIGARLEAEGETHFTVTTNERGRFTISRVRAGSWVLHIEHPGFEPLQQGVNAAATRSQDPVNVVLTRLPERALAAVEVDAANEAFLAGDWERARTSYESALEKLPEADRSPVLLGIARTHLNQQNAESAQQVLERALELDPTNVEAARLLASALSAEGEVAATQELLSRFESIEPDFNTLVGIGVSSYNSGDIDTARDHFNRAIEQRPGEPYPYYYRGLCSLSADDGSAALEDFERFLELAPEAEERSEVTGYIEYLQSERGD